MRNAIAVLMLLGVSCGNGAVREPEVKRTDEPKVEPKKEAEPIDLTQEKPKTLDDVEKDLGLAPGTLQNEMETEYLAETGDVLAVSCSTHSKLGQEATITPDGKVVLTSIGTVEVRHRSLERIAQAVTEAAVAAGVRNPKFAVSVKSIAKKFITFVGPLMTGGRLEVHGKGTILETLAGSGWKPDRRATRRIAILRLGRTSIIDIDQITGLSAVTLNIKLHANDIVIALETDPVEVKGNVAFPGTYALPRSGTIEIRDVIALSGGLKYPVDLKGVRLIRANGKAETVDLNDYLFKEAQAGTRRLLPGDTIYFPAHREIGVFVLGMVKKPGLHKVSGPVTVARALALADNEHFGAVLSDARLVRGYPDKPEVIRIDFDALFAGQSRYDLVMNDGDVLYIPESLGSDILDTLERILRPISGAVPTAVQIYTATQLGNK